jgi:hypothetical protein
METLALPGRGLGACRLLFEIRDGKVMKLILYWNRPRALAGLGPG